MPKTKLKTLELSKKKTHLPKKIRLNQKKKTNSQICRWRRTKRRTLRPIRREASSDSELLTLLLTRPRTLEVFSNTLFMMHLSQRRKMRELMLHKKKIRMLI